MTKRLLLLLSLVAGVAYASDRALGLTALVQKLNGSYLKLGKAASVDGGAFSTCYNTASPIDAGKGDAIGYTCSENAYSKNGTCTTTATTSDDVVVQGVKYVALLASDEMAIGFLQQDGGSALSCNFGHMR